MFIPNDWGILSFIISKISVVFGIALWAIFLYYLFISMFAWKRRKEMPADKFEPKNRFAIVIAAHNEEKVISNAIKSLKCVNYPKDMYDIYVVADNCDDMTASIARECGAYVLERTDRLKRGKGYALEWAFNKLFELDINYDAITVLDADNLVSQNYLLEMNKHLCMGHNVIQGYIDSKNPEDTWISGNNSIAFWISNRLIQLPRYYLGLSCTLGGTGFTIATDVLKEIGWGATCLAEDLEFTLKLILNGKKVYWAHDAVIYDEKPLTIIQSWKQRKRWMQGHFDCLKRFVKDLLLKAFKDKSIIAFDSVMYLIQPVIVAANGFGVVFGTFSIIYSIFTAKTLQAALFSILMFAFMYFNVLFVIIEGKFSVKMIKYLALVPIYNFTWIPIIIQGYIDRDKKEWFHTIHTRALDIKDVEKFQKV